MTEPERIKCLADIVSAFETAPAAKTGSELKQRQSVADPPTPDLTKRKQLSFATDNAAVLKSFPGSESDKQLHHQQFMDQHSPVLAERKSLSLADMAKAFRSASGHGLDQHQQDLVICPSTPVLGGRRSLSLINLIPSQSEMNPTTPSSLPKRKIYSPAYFGTAFESASGLDPHQQSDAVQPPAEHDEVETSTQNDGWSSWPSSFNAPPTIRVTDSRNNDDNVSIPIFYFSLNPLLRGLLIEALLILNEAETNGTILDKN